MEIWLPSAAEDTCWFYLVRHGATDANRAEPPRLQGRRTDPPLSEEGRRQARQTGRFLAAARLEAVYASPLLRAFQTAEAIATGHGLPVQVLDEVIEADVGEWEGRSWDEIQATDTQAYQAFMEDAAVNPYRGGENMQSVRQRVVPVLDRLMADHLGQSILVVAHNVVNRVYLAHLLGVPLAQYRKIRQDNCGVNLIRHRRGSTQVISLNGVFHLKDGP